MTDRTLPTTLRTALTALAAALAVGELTSTVIIWREAYPGSNPAFALAFAALFAVCAWLVRSGRVVAGALLTSALVLFEVVGYPGWAKHGALDWIFDTTFAVLSLIGLGVAIATLVSRRRSPASRVGVVGR